jgi:hypothetical protein
MNDRIAASDMTPMQWVIVGLCILLNMTDGMDVLLLSYAAPLIVSALAAYSIRRDSLDA